MAVNVTRLTLWRLAIPMRGKFRHALSERAVSEPLMVQVDLSSGATGFGETHPRSYVSGETVESAVADIRELLAPQLPEIRAENFPEALEQIDTLPLVDAMGRPCTAARAAVELALLDGYARAFRRPISEVAGWLGLPGLGPPGSIGAVRYSGVVGGETPEGVTRSIRKMRCFGLRDFKLKVGDPGDDARVRAAVAVLAGPLRAGRATLRVDANAGWTLDEARQRLRSWADLPIACVEQPLARGHEDSWYQLLSASPIPLMADESLVTPEDADSLLRHRAAGWFNVRLSKNGGLLPALRLAHLAHKHGLNVQLGCMVGETSLLSAAGRWFLNCVGRVGFAEGSYGRFLLRGDVSKRTVRFGYGGRAGAPAGPGWGVDVSEDLLRRWSCEKPVQVGM